MKSVLGLNILLGNPTDILHRRDRWRFQNHWHKLLHNTWK